MTPNVCPHKSSSKPTSPPTQPVSTLIHVHASVAASDSDQCVDITDLRKHVTTDSAQRLYVSVSVIAFRSLALLWICSYVHIVIAYSLSGILSSSFLLTLTPDVPACKTINRALGHQPCGMCSSTDPLSDIVFELSEGIHHLNGCIGIVASANITIRSLNNDKNVIIECESFPNNIVRNYDNIYVCGSSHVTFRGIHFTRCGPQSPNVFLNSSSGLVFDNCTFMYVLHTHNMYRHVHVHCHALPLEC